ncbi:hypothetical protein C2G38_2192052 [Gigaspora rosea]|uniref:Uncharacterized protein n=1 Tax=Gigaspora rosea TaxID=44941 RepID=A0A397V8F6_9GLOM|nr:hypothetical protein C2G38_2192052 [Gigaspora rosea]CAG8566943.1 13088_t:CDS:2 [Gigaspora rosea]
MSITKARNTSVETDQNPSLEGNNSTDSTNKNQVQDELSPDDFSDSEESLAMTIELHLRSLKRTYEEIHWNENHPDFLITVDSIKDWTYREDEDPSRYNLNRGKYGD